MSDREEIADLARRERFARDTADWEVLEACYWPDALIRTTWFKGSATEFIAGSKGLRAGGMISKHEISPANIRIVDDRALVESNGQILLESPPRGRSLAPRQLGFDLREGSHRSTRSGETSHDRLGCGSSVPTGLSLLSLHDHGRRGPL